MNSLDKQRVARQFSRAAAHYNRANPAQDAMASHLFNWAHDLDTAPATMLDLGCGTANLAGRVSRLYPSALAMGLDIAPGMLQEARKEIPCCIQADMEQLPLASHSLDLLLSSAALQWTETERLLPQLASLMRPGGAALLGIFVRGTLAEWQQALEQAGMDPIHDLPASSQIIEQLGPGWRVVRQQEFSTRLEFDSPEAMLMSTRRTGATNARRKQGEGLAGITRWRRLRKALEENCAGNGYQLTYRSLCLHLVPA